MVTIVFCKLCRLRKPAEAIAAAIRREFPFQVQVREGGWGSFRIEHGGVEIFNRWTSNGWLGRIGFGRTPRPDEIVELIRQRTDPGSVSIAGGAAARRPENSAARGS